MGWLELLPLLRRVLPLLDRLAPMLEGLLAGRASARAEVDRNGAAAVDATRAQDALLQVLEEHRVQVSTMMQEIESLRAGNEIFATRLQASEAQLRSLTVWVRVGTIVTPALVLVVLFLVAVLLRQHA